VKLTVINIDRAAKLVTDVYAQNAALLSRAEQRPQVQCRPGCSACCTVLALATLPEGFVLADALLSRYATSEIADLRARLDAHIEAHYARPDVEVLHRESHFAKGVPCALLGADNRCTAHVGRPAACRYHLVLSDPALCARNPDGTPNDIRMMNLEPYKMQVYAASAGNKAVPGTLMPIELAVWWALLHRVDGGAAFQAAYEDPRYTFRAFDRWLDWAYRLGMAGRTPEVPKETPPAAP